MIASTCAHCGQPLPLRRSPGPQASYCSARCHKAAYNERRRLQAQLRALGLEAQRTGPARAPAKTDTQVEQAIGDALSIAGAFICLGREAHVDLAWRCSKIGEAMLNALDRYFPEIA
jgi:hypothetical protein